MANARQKKRASTRAAQGTRKSSKQKHRKQTRSMASRARAQLRSGPLPAVQHEPESSRNTHEPESSRNADTYLTERDREPVVHTLLLEREPAQHAIERFTGNMGPVLQSGTIVASAMRAIGLELVSLIQERIHQNFIRLLALTSCRTPTQLFAAQGDIMLDNVEGLVRSTGRIAGVSMQVAHEGARRMSAGNWAPR